MQNEIERDLLLGSRSANFNEGEGQGEEEFGAGSRPVDSALCECQIVAKYQQVLEGDAIKLLKEVRVVDVFKHKAELGFDILCKSGNMLIADSLGLPALCLLFRISCLCFSQFLVPATSRLKGLH